MQLTYEIYYIVFGALIGSFLNVLVYRIPLKIDFKVKRSFCPKCEKIIPWYLNLPIISYLVLIGRCRFCEGKIPFRYLFNECITAFFAWMIFSPSLGLFPTVSQAFYFSLFCALLVHFWIDIDYQILPDGINIYIAVLNLLMAIFYFDFPWDHWVLGGIIGFGGPFAVTYLYYLWRKVVGLGGGDIKLFGAMGILIGPQGIILNIFYSCFLGSIIGGVILLASKKGKETPFAFGPFIIIVLILQLFFPALINELTKFFFPFAGI